MFLALCIAECEDELICDFAEVYHVYDYKELSPAMAAAFCFGLRQNSRVKMAITKQRVTLEQQLMARAVDELAFISWSKTVDGQKNRNRPKSVLNALLNPDTETENTAYASGDDFRAAWDKITGVR